MPLFINEFFPDRDIRYKKSEKDNTTYGRHISNIDKGHRESSLKSMRNQERLNFPRGNARFGHTGIVSSGSSYYFNDPSYEFECEEIIAEFEYEQQLMDRLGEIQGRYKFFKNKNEREKMAVEVSALLYVTMMIKNDRRDYAPSVEAVMKRYFRVKELFKNKKELLNPNNKYTFEKIFTEATLTFNFNAIRLPNKYSVVPEKYAIKHAVLNNFILDKNHDFSI
ncbi:hypothetical protein [Staphylococcus phage vB_StaM_SA1]|nr:hypothetical protein [Staphylococcus phage vB_StaM_SA1]